MILLHSKLRLPPSHFGILMSINKQANRRGYSIICMKDFDQQGKFGILKLNQGKEECVWNSCSCQITPLASIFLDQIFVQFCVKGSHAFCRTPTSLNLSLETKRDPVGSLCPFGFHLFSQVLMCLCFCDSRSTSQLPPLLTSGCSKKHCSTIAEGQFLIINPLLYTYTSQKFCGSD